jgi:hypothetical protein
MNEENTTLKYTLTLKIEARIDCEESYNPVPIMERMIKHMHMQGYLPSASAIIDGDEFIGLITNCTLAVPPE